MAFSDIKNDFDVGAGFKANAYENIAVTNGTPDREGLGDKERTDDNVDHYEKLNSRSKQDDRRNNQMETLLKRLHVMTYLNLILLIVLYITVISLTIFLGFRTIPVDGNWTQWSPWSACDVPCGYGTRIRFRTCSYPPPSGEGLNCIGNGTEIKACSSTSCKVSDGETEFNDSITLSYSYFDEIAQSYCFSRHSPGYAFAIRRDCNGVAPTCVDICDKATESMLQYINYQKDSVSCFDAIYIYKDHPHLRVNPSSRQPDAGKVNLGTYGYGEVGCKYPQNECGPNYCCCKAY